MPTGGKTTLELGCSETNTLKLELVDAGVVTRLGIEPNLKMNIVKRVDGLISSLEGLFIGSM